MLAILVSNAKGGCGKTTLATNLASAYAAGGFKVALADADPQQSALAWCARRSDTRTDIRGLDWGARIGKVPKGLERLIIDAPAAIGVARFKTLLKMADAVLLPVLPSAFDRGATARFISHIESVKPIRKNRKPLGVVANMVRPGTRAGRRLIGFLDDLHYPPVATLRARTLYPDLAEDGLGLFDRGDKVAKILQAEWTPLVTFIETLGADLS